MRQSFDRVIDSQLMNELCEKGTLVGKGIRVRRLDDDKLFGMLIPGVSVPTDWADLAFSFRARRHDCGSGDRAYMVWLIPIAAEPALRKMLPLLIQHIGAHAAAAVAQRSLPNAWGSTLAVAV